MKKIALLSLLSVLAAPAMAGTYADLLAENGCKRVDKGGYFILRSINGGPCTAPAVDDYFRPSGYSKTVSVAVPGADGTFGTADDASVPTQVSDD